MIVVAGVLSALASVACTGDVGAPSGPAGTVKDAGGAADGSKTPVTEDAGTDDGATPGGDADTLDSAPPLIDTGTPDTGAQDSAAPADTGADAPACTPTGATYAGCAAADYNDVANADAVIDFGGSVIKNNYKPKCLKIKANQKVTWSGAFSFHPLTSAPCNPAAGGVVPATSAGTDVSVTFTAPGFYGYYCAQHGQASGSGMAGVVEVY